MFSKKMKVCAIDQGRFLIKIFDIQSEFIGRRKCEDLSKALAEPAGFLQLRALRIIINSWQGLEQMIL